MTAPISFANIAPSQVAGSPRESPLAGMGEFFAALMQSRQQIAMERERLELAKKEAAERSEESALNRTKKRQELEQAEQLQQAREIVANELPGLATLPGGVTPEAIEALRVRLIQQNRKLAPYLSNEVNAQVRGLDDIRTAIAQRRTAVSTANVAEGTEQETIARAKTDLANARVALSINTIQRGLLELQRDRDPARVNSANAIFQRGGVTWGQAREAAGLAPGGIPDDMMMPTTSAGDAQARALEPIAGMFKLGKTLVDAAGNTGLTDLSAFRLTTKLQTLDLVLNKLTSPEQRQQVQGFRLMGTAFGRYISGQQSTDREAVRLMNLVAILKSDDENTRAQKRAVNDVIGQVIDAAAAGQVTPTQGMDMIIGAATKHKMPKSALDVMRQQRADAQRFERNQGRAPATRAPNDATRPSTDVIDGILGAAGFVPRPTP